MLLALIPLSGCETTSAPQNSDSSAIQRLSKGDLARVAERAKHYESEGFSTVEAREMAEAWVREVKFFEAVAKKTDRDTVSVKGRLW